MVAARYTSFRITPEGDQMQGSIKDPLLTHCQYPQYQWGERVDKGEGKLGPPRKASHICIKPRSLLSPFVTRISFTQHTTFPPESPISYINTQDLLKTIMSDSEQSTPQVTKVGSGKITTADSGSLSIPRFSPDEYQLSNGE